MKGIAKSIPVILAGSGRSGTSWIGGVLSSCAGCCPIFEPLQPRRVEAVPRFGRRSDYPGRYLRPDDTAPDWQSFFERLLRGDISNAWTRRDWTRAETLPVPSWAFGGWIERAAFRYAAAVYRIKEKVSQRYVVKMIRGNLLLAWLGARFPVRVVFLTRHPCAVVGSRLRLGWSHELDDVLAQSSLMADWLDPYRSIVESAATPLEKMTVLWCIENILPLSQVPTERWTTCSYEACAAQPDGEFHRLFQELGLLPTRRTRAAMRRLVSTPSADAGEIRPWHHSLSPSEGDEVLDICERFGIHLYGRQRMPICDIREALSQASSIARGGEVVSP